VPNKPFSQPSTATACHNQTAIGAAGNSAIKKDYFRLTMLIVLVERLNYLCLRQIAFNVQLFKIG
jgi:hypothetical protein